MKEIDCANFLANTFGMLPEHIDKDFEAIDKNGDGVVSKEEGVDGFLTFGMRIANEL